MKKRFITCLAVLCCVMLTAGACAETLTLNGTVIPAKEIQVYAPIGGTVGEVSAEAGTQVKADDILYSMKTAKVYAENDGTVTGVFGQAGDSADTVTSRYGAVLYIEEQSVFSVSASVEKAYNSSDAHYVRVGETVWLVCRSNGDRNGYGVVTSVSGASYTIEVKEGNFIQDDSVNVYRDEKHTYSQSLGRGTVSRTAPTAVSASGAIVRIAVENGQEVKKGDLLIETLDGTFDGYYMSGTEIAAGQDGILGSISVSKNSSVQKDSVAAVIYPTDVMEDYRSQIKEGDAVTIELETDESKVYKGTIIMVSSIASEGSEEVQYRVVAEFTPDDAVRFGMSTVIVTGEEEKPEEEPEEEPEAATEESEEEAAGETEKAGERPEKPEGAPSGNWPEMPADGSWPEMPADGSMPDFSGSSGASSGSGE